eukprot:467686_1
MLPMIRKSIVSQISRRGGLQAASRLMSTQEEAAQQLTLNFCLPHSPIYHKKTVDQVIIPGAAGEFGVTANHSLIVSELQPGVLQILHTGNPVPEKFFVSAGFALNHSGNVCDITAIEAVPVDQIDAEAVKETYTRAGQALAAASDDVAKAEAQIELDTAKAMGHACGLTLA